MWETLRLLLYFIKKRAVNVFEQEQEMIRVIFKGKDLIRTLLPLFGHTAVRLGPKR